MYDIGLCSMSHNVGNIILPLNSGFETFKIQRPFL